MTVRTQIFIAFAALALCAAPSVARAACPELKAAWATQDKVLPPKVDVHALRGAGAQRAVGRYEAVITQAQACLAKGSVDDRASALATISQVRYIQAWLLTHDGIASDRPKAVAIAKRSEREIKAFMASHMLSGQNAATMDNWLHFDDLMINKPGEACLGC